MNYSRHFKTGKIEIVIEPSLMVYMAFMTGKSLSKYTHIEKHLVFAYGYYNGAYLYNGKSENVHAEYILYT